MPVRPLPALFMHGEGMPVRPVPAVFMHGIIHREANHREAEHQQEIRKRLSLLPAVQGSSYGIEHGHPDRQPCDGVIERVGEAREDQYGSHGQQERCHLPVTAQPPPQRQ